MNRIKSADHRQRPSLRVSSADFGIADSDERQRVGFDSQSLGHHPVALRFEKCCRYSFGG